MYKPIKNIMKDLNNRTLSEPIQKIANFIIVNNNKSIVIKTVALFSDQIILGSIPYDLNKVSYMVKRDKKLSEVYTCNGYKPDYINVYLKIKR